MLTIGLSQMLNTTSVEQNLEQIHHQLKHFESHQVDMVAFPECAVTGFSAHMEQLELAVLLEHLDPIKRWAIEHNCHVLLPSAWMEQDQRINGGWLLTSDGQREPFYKVGLTESEKHFFKIPDQAGRRTIQHKAYTIGWIICREIEDAPYTYLPEQHHDVILWPGYYGWNETTPWQSDSDDAAPRLSTASAWNTLIAQSNWAANVDDVENKGPTGRSVVAKGAQLLAHGPLHQNAIGLLTIDAGDAVSIKWHHV